MRFFIAHCIAVVMGANGCRMLANYLIRSTVLAVLIISPSVVSGQHVIVSSSVSQSEINKSTLRAIFGMRLRNWSDSQPITVFVLGSSDPEHVKFCKNVLNMFPHQLQRTWDRLVFSGMGQAPFEVGSFEEMRKRIADTPGAIGYVNKEYVDEELRVLEIQRP